jgi:hypothetical protein
MHPIGYSSGSMRKVNALCLLAVAVSQAEDQHSRMAHARLGIPSFTSFEDYPHWQLEATTPEKLIPRFEITR